MSFFLGVQHIEIDRIMVLERARKDLGDMDELCQSIKKLGLLQAICVNKVGSEYHLVDGQRRIMAYKELGHYTIPAMIYNFDDMSLEGEYDANMVRKSFTPSEAVALAEKIKTAVENRAKLRQYNAWLKNENDDSALTTTEGAKLAQDPEAGKKTRDIVAKAVGYSHETLKKASEVVKAAERDPTKKDLVEKMDEKGKVDPVFKELQERKFKESTNNPAVQTSKDKKQKVVPVVYMPNQNVFSLSHIASERFKSGSVIAWISQKLELTDGCDILIQRRGDVVHVYKHHDLSLPLDVRLCSSDIGDTQNKSFLDAVIRDYKENLECT